MICRKPTSVHSSWLLFFVGLLLEGIFAERAFGEDGPCLFGLVGIAVTILELGLDGSIIYTGSAIAHSLAHSPMAGVRMRIGYATDGTPLPSSFLAWI